MDASAKMPGFTAERVLRAPGSYQRGRGRVAETDLVNKVVPAVPMVYCKHVCAWRVCGSPLPGYPPPMCYSCEQECWIHDSGRYSFMAYAA
jgi:hypothetical protein